MRCHSCGKNIVLYPVRQQEDKTLMQNIEERTINWKNLFKMDMMSLFFLITVILLMVGAGVMTSDCREKLNEPCKLCKSIDCRDYAPKTMSVPKIVYEAEP